MDMREENILLREQVAALGRELEVAWSLYAGIKKRLGQTPGDGRLPHDAIDAMKTEIESLKARLEMVR